MFKDKLKSITADLNSITSVNKDELLDDCINTRLTETIHRYNKSLDLSARKLNINDSFRILKAYTKWQKNKDKEAIKQLAKENKEEDTKNA